MHLAYYNKARRLDVKKLTHKVEYTGGTLPPMPPLVPAAYDSLFFYGAHGNCKDGEPTLLNGLSVATVKDLVRTFADAKVTFKNIVLDCSMTASFIPIFLPLLPTSGEANIIANWGPASEVIAVFVDRSKNLGAAVVDFIDTVTRGMKEITAQDEADVFCPVVLYTHGTREVHRKRYTDLKASFEVNPSNDADDYPDLAAIDERLMANGVKGIADLPMAVLRDTIEKSVTVPL